MGLWAQWIHCELDPDHLYLNTICPHSKRGTRMTLQGFRYQCKVISESKHFKCLVIPFSKVTITQISGHLSIRGRPEETISPFLSIGPFSWAPWGLKTGLGLEIGQKMVMFYWYNCLHPRYSPLMVPI